MALLILFAALIALGVLGSFIGTDSRDGRDWQTYELPRGSHGGSASVPVRSGGTFEGT
jgi:hypothetical protein